MRYFKIAFKAQRIAVHRLGHVQALQVHHLHQVPVRHHRPAVVTIIAINESPQIEAAVALHEEAVTIIYIQTLRII